MKEFIFTLAAIVIFSIIVLAIYKGLYKFVLSKFKVNKWLVLAIAVVEFVVPPFLFPNMPAIVSNYILPAVFVILILWFVDIMGWLKRYDKPQQQSNYYNKYASSKNKKDITIRPKAKPNRVKNKDK